MTELVIGSSPTARVSGLEAIHTWDGAIALNNRDEWPQFRIRSIGGLYSKPDHDYGAEALVGKLGEIPRVGFKRGKTLAYGGDVRGRTLTELREAIALLGQAFAADDEREMVVVEHPSYGSNSYKFRARCVSLELGEEQLASPFRASRGYERPFAIGLRMYDPRFYATQPTTNDTAELTSQEGITLPIFAPFTIPGTETTAGVVTVTNLGTAETDPIIRIHGPVSNPTIENLTYGYDLRFTVASLTLNEGHFLEVQFGSRRVLVDGTSDGRRYLDIVNSNWWDAGVPGLAPGDNEIRFSGTYSADPARAEIEHYDAWWS